MPSLFFKVFGKIAEELHSTPEELAYKKLPLFLLDLMEKYFRVKTVGQRYIPKKGPCIVIANHSGFMGFDAMMLAYEIYKNTGRVPRIVAHKLWFLHPDISIHAKKFGMIPATFDNAYDILKSGELLLLFPEGEEGNFKPTRLRYHLRKFRRGCTRLALKTGAPIVPAAVIGAEETSITLSQLRWAKELFGVIIPVPLNIIPIPVKWKIRFYAPVRFKVNLKRAEDTAEVKQITRRLRHKLQSHIHNLLKQRDLLFL